MRADSEETLGYDDYKNLAIAQTRSRRSSALRILKYSIVALLSAWALINISITVFERVPFFNGGRLETEHGCYCGNSTMEAKSMGCKYDSLAAAWLPEHCRDDELTAEFELSGPGENGTVSHLMLVHLPLD